MIEKNSSENQQKIEFENSIELKKINKKKVEKN